MYLVMLATKHKVWVDARLARQLQLNNRVLFTIREEGKSCHGESPKQNRNNGGAL